MVTRKAAIFALGGIILVGAGFGTGRMTAPAQEAVIVDGELPSVPALTPEQQKAEEDWLRIDLDNRVDTSGVEPLKGVKNEIMSECPRTAYRIDRATNGLGKRAFSDIAVYLAVTNVIATKDCSCEAKILPDSTVSAFEDRLREELGVELLEPEHTASLYEQYKKELPIAEALCGGRF